MDRGGAAKAAIRLHLGLKSIDVQSKMLVLRRTSSEVDVIRFIKNNNIFRRAWHKIHKGLISLEFNAYNKTSPKRFDMFTDDKTVYKISEHPLVREADVIHLHWIAEMVDYTEFFPKVMNKPIIWTLHDSNPFTGGCHVPGDCTKYENGCGACPQLGSKDQNDLSKKIFKRKEKAYKGKNIHIVTPSRWLRDCAKRSLLFKNFPVDVIPNGVPTDIFKKGDRHFQRKLLNLPQDKTLILFGVDYKTERKGFKYLVQALKLLKEKINISKIALVTFGPKQDMDIISKNTRLSIYQLGYLKEEALLSAVYSSVDVCVIPSLYENFPNIILESFSCGTPIVGVYSAGIPDMIIPHETGLLAELKNTKDLADKIEYMVTHPEERRKMGENARKLAEQECTLQIQAQRYLELYKRLFKT